VDQIYVRGGNPLRGRVRVAGSKNASLAIMAASLLVEGPVTLSNVPDIRDIHTMAELLREVGATVRQGAGTLEIDASGFDRTEAPEDLARQMRASFYVLGPMIARLGAARVPQPGGCRIGARPVDFHIRGMQALGARVTTEGGIVDARAAGLTGCNIYLDFPSAGATSQIMCAASLARGTTLIENAASEPEILDLGNFLNALGARITGHGTPTVRVEGVPRLRPGAEYQIIPDRMEAGTYACAAAITQGDLVLEQVIASHLHPVLVKLQDMGVQVELDDTDDEAPGEVRIAARGRCRAVDILAMPHPGFPTDMQQPMVALLCLSDGNSVVTDRVFENRFRFVDELQKMGANVRAEGRTAFVQGVPALRGAPVAATDLRAGAALIVAALGAQGMSVISGVEHVDRGYAGLVEKLQSAGADITRHDGEPAPDLPLPQVPLATA